MDVEKIFGNQERINEKKKICYARVSSEKQKEDLDRQCEYLRQKCPDHELIKDIGSGLNWKRKGFTSILERSYQRDIEEVVVTHKDRLCRFAFELVEWIFSKHDTKIVVLGSDVNIDIPNPVSLSRTYYQSLLSSRQDTMGSDQPKIENDEERLKTRKIRIYPTPEEKTVNSTH